MAKYGQIEDDGTMYEGFRTKQADGTTLEKDLIKMVVRLLMKGELKKKYICSLMKEPEVVRYYQRAFTHKTYNSINNYEFFEFLGDGTVNNSVIWYVSRKFPEYELSINPSEVLTRLKITIISKQSLSNMADELGFWQYIRATELQMKTDRKSMLEDVFESFIGTTQYVIDKYIQEGAGYAVCSKMIGNLLDDDSRIKTFVTRRDQGLPAIDFYDVCDSVTILKQTMEDSNLGLRSIGRIIPNPNNPYGPTVHVNDKSPARIGKQADYVVYRGRQAHDDVSGLSMAQLHLELNDRHSDQPGASKEQLQQTLAHILSKPTYPKVFMEYWLERGTFTGKGNQLIFTPDRGRKIVRVGHAAGFDQKKAIQDVSKQALTYLETQGLSKPIPASYMCTAVDYVPE